MSQNDPAISFRYLGPRRQRRVDFTDLAPLRFA